MVNTRKMDVCIGTDERYETYNHVSRTFRSKTAIGLVLQTYLPKNAAAVPENLDLKVRALKTRQIRLCIFVGHNLRS